MLFAAVGGNSPQKSKIVRAPITSLIHKLEPNDICVDPFPGLLVRLKCICGLSLPTYPSPTQLLSALGLEFGPPRPQEYPLDKFLAMPINMRCILH